MKPHPLFFFDDVISFIFEWSKILSQFTLVEQNLSLTTCKIWVSTQRDKWQFSTSSSTHSLCTRIILMFWKTGDITRFSWSAHIFWLLFHLLLYNCLLDPKMMSQICVYMSILTLSCLSKFLFAFLHDWPGFLSWYPLDIICPYCHMEISLN